MDIAGFEIRNFKGIQKANIRFSENNAARVHTLVGLNESGKTTLLEALHSFSPDAEARLVVQSARSVADQRNQSIPRHQIASFSGEISVTAYVIATQQDWERVKDVFKRRTSLTIGNARAQYHGTELPRSP